MNRGCDYILIRADGTEIETFGNHRQAFARREKLIAKGQEVHMRALTWDGSIYRLIVGRFGRTGWRKMRGAS